jgi:hypothetical protein
VQVVHSVKGTDDLDSLKGDPDLRSSFLLLFRAINQLPTLFVIVSSLDPPRGVYVSRMQILTLSGSYLSAIERCCKLEQRLHQRIDIVPITSSSLHRYSVCIDCSIFSSSQILRQSSRNMVTLSVKSLHCPSPCSAESLHLISTFQGAPALVEHETEE